MDAIYLSKEYNEYVNNVVGGRKWGCVWCFLQQWQWKWWRVRIKEIDICYFEFNNTFFAIDSNFDDKPSKFEY